MLKLLIVFIGISWSVHAKELHIISDKSFQDRNITLQEIKDIFLAKKRFLDGKKILVMNYKYDNTLRHCFEQSILKKSPRSIKRYWQKAYYRGKRPPKIINSSKMLFSYMQKIQPSIGYVTKHENLPEYTLTLFEVTCKE